MRAQYGALVSDLATRAVHCCYGEHWAGRVGGAAALSSLVPRLPASALPRLAPLIMKALFVVLRTLPEHAIEEAVLRGVLRTVLQRCVEAGAAAGPDAQDAAGAGHQPASGGDSDHQDAAHLPQLLKQLMEIFVQHLLSSRSSMAVRTAASAGLEVRSSPRQLSGTVPMQCNLPLLHTFLSPAGHC